MPGAPECLLRAESYEWIGISEMAVSGASSSLPRVRAKVASQSDLPTLIIVHLKPVVC